MATISLLQLKRGTRSALEKNLKGDNKPKNGEPIYEIDTNKLRVGDGINDYYSLPYLTCSCDDVVAVEFYDNFAAFPIIGLVDKLYVDKSTNKIYSWNEDSKSYTLMDGGSSSGSIVYADTVYEFPKTGDANTLYIATEENNTYFWKNGYKLAGIDSREIDAGGADADEAYNRGRRIGL